MMAIHRRRNGKRRRKLAVLKAVTYLTKEEVERFFRAIPQTHTRDRLLFDLVYRYGLRRREVALIQRDHLSEGRIWITRVKGGISGEYPIPPSTRRLLWAYLAERGEGISPYLFTTRQSGAAPISSSTIYQAFRAYAAIAELPAERSHPHILRHSLAVHIMNLGADVADVQDWLGHRQITSTMVYARVTNKRREDNHERMEASSEIAAMSS